MVISSCFINKSHFQELLFLIIQIAPRRGRPSLEALACVGSFAKAMGPAMEPHVRGLLDSMFSAGLSPTLIDALEQISLRLFNIHIYFEGLYCYLL